jgi:hypothetical protein
VEGRHGANVRYSPYPLVDEIRLVEGPEELDFRTFRPVNCAEAAVCLASAGGGGDTPCGLG